MRALVAFLLSFVFVGTVGTMILPGPSFKAKPKPPTGSARVKPILDFLPDVPSFAVPRIEDTSKRYEEAWRLLKAGQWRAAEGAYLQIVMRAPQDRKAMQGLVTLQRLLANQNPERLQEQAEAYRRAIAEGRTMEDQYTAREMELLAEASLFAVNEIATEQNLKFSAHSRVSISSGLLSPASLTPSPVARDPVNATKERISQVARSLRLAPAKPGVGVPVVDTQHVAPFSIARTPRFELSGGGKPSGGPIDEVANSATENPQGPTDPGGDTSLGGPTLAGSRSNAGVNDSSREGGGGNSGGSSTGSGGSGTNAGSGAGGPGSSASGSGNGAGGTAGGSGNSAGKDGGGKAGSGSEKSGGGKGGTGKGGKD